MWVVLKKFWADEAGGAIVEFAFVLPILLNIIITMFELGIVLAIKLCLENGVTAGARFGSTGTVTPGYTRDQSIANIITSKGGVLISPASIATSVTSYNSFAQLGSGGTAGAGTTLQVVKYVASYTYVPVTPIVVGFFGSSKVLTLTAYGKNDDTFL